MRLLAILLLATLALVLAPAGASPSGTTCDPQTGRLVCAGATYDVRFSCGADASGLGACSWTSGFTTWAFSPSNLPGDANQTRTWSARAYCSDSGWDACGDFGTSREWSTCVWVTPQGCTTTTNATANSFKHQLAPGDCMVVDVDLGVEVRAGVPPGLGTAITSADHIRGNRFEGSACFNP